MVSTSRTSRDVGHSCPDWQYVSRGELREGGSRRRFTLIICREVCVPALGHSPSVAVHSRDAAVEHSRVAVVYSRDVAAERSRDAAAVHSRDVAAERSRVAVVRPRVAVVRPRVAGERCLDEPDSAREMKSVDDQFAHYVRSPGEGSPAATKRAAGVPQPVCCRLHCCRTRGSPPGYARPIEASTGFRVYFLAENYAENYFYSEPQSFGQARVLDC